MSVRQKEKQVWFGVKRLLLVPATYAVHYLITLPQPRVALQHRVHYLGHSPHDDGAGGAVVRELARGDRARVPQTPARVYVLLVASQPRVSHYSRVYITSGTLHTMMVPAAQADTMCCMLCENLHEVTAPACPRPLCVYALLVALQPRVSLYSRVCLYSRVYITSGTLHTMMVPAAQADTICCMLCENLHEVTAPACPRPLCVYMRSW
ncbi:hypothetical protein O0L34_g17996 [Tuta absoluta]|nr:hypothetical protein O0L34_g17996 [Tuta absoluta]